MKIRFELSEDLYFLVDWEYITLPQQGESIRLRDFIEKDESNLYYGFKNKTLGGYTFKSFKEWEQEELFINEREEKSRKLTAVSDKSGGYISLTRQPFWERNYGELVMVFKLDFFPKGITVR